MFFTVLYALPSRPPLLLYPSVSQPEKVRLQECGPRFTLRLRALQRGTFDRTAGEYEWVAKKEDKISTNRRRFVL